MVRKVTQSDDLHTLRSFRNASSALDSLYGQLAKACFLSVNEYLSLVLMMRHWEEHAWKSMDEQERIMLSELTWKLYHLIEELYLREENEK